MASLVQQRPPSSIPGLQKPSGI